jgi:hypothetical protein
MIGLKGTLNVRLRLRLVTQIPSNQSQKKSKGNRQLGRAARRVRQRSEK